MDIKNYLFNILSCVMPVAINNRFLEGDCNAMESPQSGD